MKHHSELSVASLVFMFIGGGLAVLINLTFAELNPGGAPLRIVTAVIAFALVIIIAVLGHRFGVFPAGLLMIVTQIMLMGMVVQTPSVLGALNIALMFPTVLLYLVWFMPLWFMRLSAYTWVFVYAAVMSIKFGTPVYPLMLTFMMSMTVLGELVVRFKNNLEETSLTDPLSGVWNTRGFERLLHRAIRAARRSGQPLSLVFIDIDDFKLINDTHGHREGDRILTHFSRELERLTRPQDVVARVGGDEFVMLLPGTTQSGAEHIAERLREQVESVSWSYGVEQLSEELSPEELVARADTLMREEKRSRKSLESDGR